MDLNHFLKRRNKNWQKTISTVFLILAIRKMLIKTALRFFNQSVAKINKTMDHKWQKWGNHHAVLVGFLTGTVTLESHGNNSQKSKHKSTIGPGMPLLSTSLKYLTFCFPDSRSRHVHCCFVHIARKCPSAGARGMRMQHTYSKEYYSIVKKSEI